MAWYNDGIWNDLRIDRTGHLLHQMCYAVNEREAFLGRTLSTWGGRGSYPAAYQFDGIRMDRRGDVLATIRAALPSLYDVGESERFVQSDGSNWTEAALLTAAGYGASWIEVDGATNDDMTAYLQTRGVIEELIYYLAEQVTTITVDSNISNMSGVGRYWYGDEQEIYDRAIANLADSTIGLGELAKCERSDSISMGGGSYEAEIGLITQSIVRLRFPSGVKPVRCPIELVEYCSLINSKPDPMTLDINGTEVILDLTGADNTEYLAYTLGDTMAFVNTHYSGGYWYTDLDCKWDYPLSDPFLGDYIHDGHQRSLSVGNQSQTVLVLLTLTPTYG